MDWVLKTPETWAETVERARNELPIVRAVNRCVIRIGGKEWIMPPGVSVEMREGVQTNTVLVEMTLDNNPLVAPVRARRLITHDMIRAVRDADGFWDRVFHGLKYACRSEQDKLLSWEHLAPHVIATDLPETPTHWTSRTHW